MTQPMPIIVPLPVGAEVRELTSGAEQDPDVRALLYDAWLAHGFLLFRGVATVEQHLAISRCFGELEIHPMPEVRSQVHPLLIDIGGPKRNVSYVYDEAEMRQNRIPWHRDTAYTPDICKGAMLRMVEAPPEGGETLIADTARAYDDLPEDLKARIDGLEHHSTLRLGPVSQTRPGAIWRTARRATVAEDPDNPPSEDQPEVLARYPSVIHPAVLRHPESGRKSIFLSPTYVDRFLGLSQEESDELLVTLTQHMLQPRYVYKHRWADDDAILWDNRRCMHAGMGNRLGERRWGLRTTLAERLRTGRYADEGAEAPDTLLVD